MKSETYERELRVWMESEFEYKEWGAGARINIVFKDGVKYGFANFDNHMEAETFLYLIDKLRNENS